MANNRTRNECLSAASHVVQIHTHARFPRGKKWPTYRVAVCSTNRKRSSFATKHFQRKSLKIFDLHPPPRRLVSFVVRINHVKSEMLSNRHTDTHTDTQTKYRNPRCACTPRVNHSFLGFAQVLSALIVQKNCQNRLLLRHNCVYRRLLINYVCGHIDDPPTLN